jgi:hypothetical protein
MVGRAPGESRRRRTGAAAKKQAGEGPRATEVRVEEDERRHLIEDCAFFRATQFRPVDPGGYREEDVRDVAKDIDAVLKTHRQRTARR